MPRDAGTLLGPPGSGGSLRELIWEPVRPSLVWEPQPTALLAFPPQGSQ